MTECASVIIECEDYTKLDQQTWKLTVKGDTKIEGTSSATFEKKMRCDAMNLISRNPSADNEKKVVLTNTPSIDFAYLNAVKECAADELMTYTENGDMSEKHAESIACKKNGDAYQYAVKAYDKGGNGQTTYIPAEHNISVICIAPKCRMCTPLQPFPDAECPKGSDCKKKKVAEEPHPPSLEECFTLNIECDKLMILNGKIEKASPKKVKCDGTGKYMHENIVINKLSCLEQYSPYDKTFPKTSLKSIQKQYEVLTTEPEGCEEFGDCFCKDPKQKLAFANSQGTEWRRVENITFDSDNNKWMYERKVNNADEKAELNANRSVMCVAALMTPAALPNKKSGLVYATSLGILFLVAIISIVAVILLVNARIKKRELHKAKKEEDKKKKKGDADKKDDDKKDNEQKNEA
ncbi:hypothetical protein PFISCL1PPCAC_25277 [Pristionchus fissidentatus]|uniref:Uncharacterized protein n=1 Tax=Pristionchus fissidentatus TaxID=1538716 RepID=A0AAV5WQU5_9BILA|nr:hypothetical protein PFISCL1PPCAC_25277 [Pristionchus fissidentatus]